MSEQQAPKGNVKNPAIRRIHADIRELQKDPSDQYHAAPLEENLFEWHFTLRGPPSTDYAGGIYHGRILLPADYPFKPPNIMLLTPNGRFEVGKKICLSISAHHPEHWQPAWGVRLILEALISFFPTEPKGAVGSLDWTPRERQRLAVESQIWSCPRCGVAQALLPPLLPPSSSSSSSTENGGEEGGEGGKEGGERRNKYAEEISQLYVRGASDSFASQEEEEGGRKEGREGGGAGGAGGDGEGRGASLSVSSSSSSAVAAPTAASGGVTPLPPSLSPPPVPVRGGEGGAAGRGEGGEEGGLRRRVTGASSSSTSSSFSSSAATRPLTQPPPPAAAAAPVAVVEEEEEEGEEEKEDKLFYLAVCLFGLLVLLVGRKVVRAWAREGGAACLEGSGSAGAWGEEGGDLYD